MRSTQDIIVKLLTNLGSRKEVEQYLKHYAGVDAQKFAIVKVGGSIIDTALDNLASSLTFLERVGLTPIVVHGAGPQLTRALERANIPTERINGLRVTTPLVLEVARKVFQHENLLLVDALEGLGTRARPVTSGVFRARRSADARLGLVGEVTEVDDESITSSLRAAHIPVVAPLGETQDGQILNINADIATRELALALKPHKVVFLTETGGLLDEQKAIISAINLEEDYEALLQAPWVTGGMRLKIQEIQQLLQGLPPTSSVSITSPDHLAKELFTHRGAGTLVRRGERVTEHDTFEPIDTGRLRTLLEACFQRKLAPDYFSLRTPHKIYLAESYRATAILTREEGIPYLDKFAVTTEAQGVGVGGSIWARMKRNHPKLYWRSRVDNPINAWYFQNADGSYKSDRWVVFWYGIPSFDECSACISRALSLPPTFSEHGTAEV